MPATRERWTAARVRELQDESRAWPRYELIDGELLVTPSPLLLHQRAVGEIGSVLRDYVRENGIGEVLYSPADIVLEADTIVQPDVFVVPSGKGRRPKAWQDVKELILACEVLSPSTARHDRVTKRRFFSRTAVGEYWVVDIDARIVERSGPGDDRVELIAEKLVWRPPGAATHFTLDLSAFFEAVCGED